MLLPHVHETWHLMLGDFDLLATKGSEGYVCRCRVVIRAGTSVAVDNGVPATLKTMTRFFFRRKR